MKKHNIEHYVCPLIEIKKKPLSLRVEEQVLSLKNLACKHIFVSSNAVEYALPYLKVFCSCQEKYHSLKNTFYAIGKKTQHALYLQGYQHVQTPAPPYNSENLLALESLQNRPAPTNSHHLLQDSFVILWSGSSGRTVIKDHLSCRGYNVILAEVYQRLPLLLDKTQKKFLKKQRTKTARPFIITATSKSVLDCIQNTEELSDPSNHIVSLSRRITEYAQQQKWHNIVTTEKADEKALTQSILKLYSSLNRL